MAEARARELLRREEVEQRFGVSRSWIYCEMRAGRFPEPVRIGKRAVRWKVVDLDEWACAQAGGAWGDWPPPDRPEKIRRVKTICLPGVRHRHSTSVQGPPGGHDATSERASTGFRKARRSSMT